MIWNMNFRLWSMKQEVEKEVEKEDVGYEETEIKEN